MYTERLLGICTCVLSSFERKRKSYNFLWNFLIKALFPNINLNNLFTSFFLTRLLNCKSATVTTNDTIRL